MEINRTKIITDAISTSSPTHSNGLAATTLISTGSTILSTTKPYLLLLENGVWGSVCSWCLLPPSKASSNPTSSQNTSDTAPPKLKRCARCHFPNYCSTPCQRAHWTATHKYECATLSSLPSLPGPLPTPVRALMQILLLPDGGKPWLGMESHEEDLRQDKESWESVVLQARGAVMYSGLGEKELGRAVGLLCRMKTNSFRFTSPSTLSTLSISGILFDPLLAMANHSCTPNAELECDGRHVQLLALREIAEGEQVFISYIDEELPVEERRTMLEERYFFTCRCDRCVLEAKEAEERRGDPA